MPIAIRNFSFNQMKKYYDEQNEQESDNNVDQSIANMRAAGAVNKQNSPKVNIPDYVAKSSKK